MLAHRARGFAITSWQFEYLLDRAAKLQARERLLSPAFNASARRNGGKGSAPSDGAGETSGPSMVKHALQVVGGTASPGTSPEPRELPPHQGRLTVIPRSHVTLYSVDPLHDPRWCAFVEKHPRASVFHSIPWLEALRRTYGYEPIVYTSSSPGKDLEDGVVFCCVKSWVTGHRLVSLPFSDHCEPLVNDPTCLHLLLSSLEKQFKTEEQSSVELRPVSNLDWCASLHPIESYHLHSLDLSPDLHTLRSNLHKASAQGKIRRAELVGLTYKEGRGESLLDEFYHLLLLERRRQGWPPQPRSWYRSLLECFGKPLKIRVAYKGALPIASIITIRHKDSLVYKYGCSDVGFHNLGGMHLLFWRSILEAKSEGLRIFDLGRSARGDIGLITFMNRWGAIPSPLTYYRYASSLSARSPMNGAGAEWKTRIARMAKPIVSRMPDKLISAAGSLLHKHFG